MPLEHGSTLGPYQVTAKIGEGGMGVVYTAQDPRLKRQMAIKLLPPDLTRDVTAKQGFHQEAQATSALDESTSRRRLAGGASDSGGLRPGQALWGPASSRRQGHDDGETVLIHLLTSRIGPRGVHYVALCLCPMLTACATSPHI